ncbi:MAG: alkaline phosphatase family protein [Verrucomicrobiota bacterium]
MTALSIREILGSLRAIINMHREYRTFALILMLLFSVRALSLAEQPASGRHVVVIVWDGMRPDFVSEENTPVLRRIAKEGVVFRNHHPVYPSSTEVNGVALATGVYPARSGVLANHEYRSEINDRKSIDTENLRTVRKSDELSGGKYIGFPTIAELVRKAGHRTIIASAKGVGLLQDRDISHSGETNHVTLFAGNLIPQSALAPIVTRLGPFPSPEKTHALHDNWTTSALAEFLWKDGVPDFSLVWLSEPDDSEHHFAPGSKEAIAAIKASDANLGRIVAALDRHRVRESTDIFVVSDHGFSTIERSVDLPNILKQAGFDAVTEFENEPKPGQIMLAGNGGTVLFYVVQHDAAVIRRLVEFLQQSDFAGVIFTKSPMEGTFGLAAAEIDNDHAPDFEMSFRWKDSKNQFGVSGMIDADWQRRAGKGTHATLGRFDMHNTLIVAGPDFQQGQSDNLPSGNVDLAPTILRILEIDSPSGLDGRILSEAMVKGDPQSLSAKTSTVEAKRDFPSGTWRQTLQISRVGSTSYLDEGNGAFVPKRP